MTVASNRDCHTVVVCCFVLLLDWCVCTSFHCIKPHYGSFLAPSIVLGAGGIMFLFLLGVRFVFALFFDFALFLLCNYFLFSFVLDLYCLLRI